MRHGESAGKIKCAKGAPVKTAGGFAAGCALPIGKTPGRRFIILAAGSVVILFLWITDLREIFLRIQLLVRVDVADVKHRPCRFISSAQTASPAQQQSYRHN
jgi:hypothetical protein